MTQDEYMSVAESFDKAEESVTPFPIVTDDEIVVVGDANETEINENDYKIAFRVPTFGEDGKIKYKLQEIEYKNIYITPRQDPKIQAILLELIPFFRKAQESGEVGRYSKEEIKQLLDGFSFEIEERMYKLVVEVLGVDPTLMNFMSYDSVLTATAQIIRDYANIANEGLAFFPQSSDEQQITKDR